jgi:hypothetical protein
MPEDLKNQANGNFLLPIDDFNKYFHFFEVAYRVDDTHVRSMHTFSSWVIYSHHSLILSVPESGEYIMSFDTPMLYQKPTHDDDNLSHIQIIVQDFDGQTIHKMDYFDQWGTRADKVQLEAGHDYLVKVTIDWDEALT